MLMTKMTKTAKTANNVVKLDPVAVRTRLERFTRLNREEELARVRRDYATMRAVDAERREGLQNGWGPVAGLPATVSIGSDKYAALVTWVSPSGHQVRVREKGELEERRFTRCSDGYYRRERCYRLTFLRAVDYRDPSF